MERLFPLGGVSQKRENLGDFMEMAWPSVREEQRDGILVRRPLMHKVDCQDVKVCDGDGERELREFIDFCFVRAPIVLCEPVVDESLDFAVGRAVCSLALVVEVGGGPSQVTSWSWSGKRASRSFSFVRARRESGTAIVKGRGCCFCCADMMGLEGSWQTLVVEFAGSADPKSSLPLVFI
jgi:hypothetical protein